MAFIILVIGTPILLFLLILIFGIRDGLKNGFPKSTGGDDMFDGVNPATGLPMVSGSVDAGGNPYGINVNGD